MKRSGSSARSAASCSTRRSPTARCGRRSTARSPRRRSARPWSGPRPCPAARTTTTSTSWRPLHLPPPVHPRVPRRLRVPVQPAGAPMLEAVDLLRDLNARRQRKVPPDAPVEFVPARWRPYVIDRDGEIDRHYFELCVLWELRAALRAGDVWLETSRRYADPETYLIPRERWPRPPGRLPPAPAPRGRGDPVEATPGRAGGGADPARPGLAAERVGPDGGGTPGAHPARGRGAARGERRAAGEDRRAAAPGRAERAAHRGRRLDALQRRLRARRRDGAAEPGTAGAISMRRSWPRRATSA